MKSKNSDFINSLLKKGYVKDSAGNYVPPSMAKKVDSPNPTPLKTPVKSSYFTTGETQIRNSNILMVFNIDPIGKPRMTSSDKWKVDPLHPDPKKRQRKPVTQYFRFKSNLITTCLEKGFKMPEDDIHLIFVLPMPHSWPEKKKSQFDGSRHKQKPDSDNMIKAVLDCLMKEDKSVSDIRGTKFWGRTGKIIVMSLQPFNFNDV
jgi:Holliday junction resolvase RusA-like endonuclease